MCLCGLETVPSWEEGGAEEFLQAEGRGLCPSRQAEVRPPPSSLSGRERAALPPALTLRVIKGWASLPPPLHPHSGMSF